MTGHIIAHTPLSTLDYVLLSNLTSAVTSNGRDALNYFDSRQSWTETKKLSNPTLSDFKYLISE